MFVKKSELVSVNDIEDIVKAMSHNTKPYGFIWNTYKNTPLNEFVYSLIYEKAINEVFSNIEQFVKGE